jgi:lysophospholipase L1-like esterase
LTGQIDRLVQSIKKECPEALFLLTTPADNKLRKTKKRRRRRRVTYYVENKNLAVVAEAIKEYGEKNNIAVWDWYTIAGGEGSCEKWIKEEGMRNDHIHYTAKGYSIQGNLLYKSLMNAYEQHIR